MGMPEDLEPGRRILDAFRPFLLSLIHKGLSRKTVRNHIDNIWCLGGILITNINYDESLRSKNALSLIADSVFEDGGPYSHHFSEAEQKSFDSTCRKLHRFLLDVESQEPANPSPSKRRRKQS